MAGELDDAVFIDTDAEWDQIAGDLRWACPRTVIVDDAGDHDQLLRRLSNLRRTESDMFDYRLVAVCWPDELEAVQASVPGATAHNVELVERGPINDLLLHMGITGHLARAEILDQAEGRPGWAVALGDLLLRARDVVSLRRGKALFGQVGRYLRRAGIQVEAMDLLAAIAALGSVSERELPDVREEADISRTATAAIIESAARGGLIDVAQRYSLAERRSQRYFTVRPPMLADVLVAERLIARAVPVVSIEQLVDRWPYRISNLAMTAIRAVELGHDDARGLAQHLFDRALASDDLDHSTATSLAESFLRLGEAPAEYVVRIARRTFDDATADADPDPWRIASAVRLAALAARWYHSRAAFALLFDACVVDTRSTNPNPDHPLRKIQDLVTDFHPEVLREGELRYELADALNTWRRQALDDPPHRRAVADIMSMLMTLRLSARYSDPGAPRTIRMIESVVPPDEMQRIHEELMPLITEMLDDRNDRLFRTIIDVAEAWLYTGSGHDRPFGRAHSNEAINTAKQIGTALVATLAARTDLGIGLRVRLQRLAARHGIPVTAEIPEELEPFFRDVDRREGDWLEAEREVVADLERIGCAWAADDPSEVINRLVRLRHELDDAGTTWPDHSWIVCRKLAEGVDDPVRWLDAAETAGFMPAGCVFAERALDAGQLTHERAIILLNNPTTHGSMLHALLLCESAEPWVLTAAADAVSLDDFYVIETAAIRSELSDDVLNALLTRPTAGVRGMVALAMFRESHGVPTGWSPGGFEARWLDALRDLRPFNVRGASDYVVAQLFRYLAVRFPATLVSLIAGALTDAESNRNGSTYSALPHDAWHTLYLLPGAQKLKLMSLFRDHPTVGQLLQEHLIGTDIGWLEEMLDARELTAEEAIASFRGVGPQPPVEELARILLPRGVQPSEIAVLRKFGTHVGDESAHCASIVADFEGLLQSDDPSVRALAEAGVKMFTEAGAKAAEEERLGRIRGYE